MRPIFFLFAPVLAGLALPAASQVPAWVLNPPSEWEMAAGDCVDYSGSIAIDRQQVAASARLALAQQIPSSSTKPIPSRRNRLIDRIQPLPGYNRRRAACG